MGTYVSDLWNAGSILSLLVAWSRSSCMLHGNRSPPSYSTCTWQQIWSGMEQGIIFWSEITKGLGVYSSRSPSSPSSWRRMDKVMVVTLRRQQKHHRSRRWALLQFLPPAACNVGCLIVTGETWRERPMFRSGVCGSGRSVEWAVLASTLVAWRELAGASPTPTIVSCWGHLIWNQ